MDADVIIVGGGPGGAAAAVALAQRGITNVMLLDRESFPRDKTCGSGLSPNALNLCEELGIGEAVRRLAYPIQSVRVVTQGDREMVLASNAAALVLLRRHFDNLLVEKATASGVTLKAPFRADGLLFDDDQRVVGVRGFDGSELKARYVLCADGAHSMFTLDARPKRSISTLMGWWDGMDFVPGQLDMIFDKSLSPLYGWLFPESDTRVNIGICIDGQDASGTKQPRPLREVFDAFLQKHYGPRLAKATQVGKLKGHPIVYTNWITDCVRPGALYLGEAARITHNATGEGIYQAMQSGIFAAQAVATVLKGQESEAECWREYVAAHRKRFTAGIVGGHVLRAVVASPLLDGMARLYNSPMMRKAVVKLLGSALAGSSVSDATDAVADGEVERRSAA